MKTLFSVVNELERNMTFHRERQSVIAGNIANLDTPGYKPMDLSPTTGAEAFAHVMARTNPGHLESPQGSSSVGSLFEDPTAAGADGNAVSLEREMAKLDANRVRYGTSTELVSRKLAMLRYAASDGNG